MSHVILSAKNVISITLMASYTGFTLMILQFVEPASAAGLIRPSMLCKTSAFATMASISVILCVHSALKIASSATALTLALSVPILMCFRPTTGKKRQFKLIANLKSALMASTLITLSETVLAAMSHVRLAQKTVQSARLARKASVWVIQFA